MLEALKRHTDQGRELRVLTTVYTGSTEQAALELLHRAGADIRVSYDTTTTRLHAKAWIFSRDSGFSTAYIGSSNLTHSAQVTGLEWNVRVSGARNPAVVEKIAAVFETYWHSGDFVPYEPDCFRDAVTRGRRTGPVALLSPVEIRLEPFQERLLEQVELSREQGHHRNLLASATGTGKTVMAAVDYARLRERQPRSRLLFVAHRKEILEQSLETFRHALREHDFGELWVSGNTPAKYDHVFASIQSLTATGLDHLAPDHFDVVIVDEFHHAAAQSYDRLLTHLEPAELLGLTATPERTDGLPVLHWFDDRIAAELRLWDAIDQHRLTPFLYYGIHDGLDLRAVPWKRGRGYDVDELSNLFTSDEAWARLTLKQLRDKVGDPTKIRALGFCVSINHARFMAQVFNRAGVPSRAIWSDTPADARKVALEELQSGKVNVVFSIDLFNEGVDVPKVDTLLLLRPTDSGLLFLQQLGRGLRKESGKPVCTVLDFVGHHRKEFRFDRRFRALLGGTRREVERQVEQRFPFLPAGCHMELDDVAQRIVLENIRRAVPSRWKEKANELRAMAARGKVPNLGEFLKESGLELGDVYDGRRSWSDLLQEADQEIHPRGPAEEILRRGCGRMLHVDDAVRLEAYRSFLSSGTPPLPQNLGERDRRLLRMLVASLADKALSKSMSLEEGVQLVWQHPQIRHELLDLLEVLSDRVEHLHQDLSALPDVPLRVHARYTRIEILSAFGHGDRAKVPPWQTGCQWLSHVPADLFAFTLDKTSGQFSPTTRYRDYAISRDRIHWESQSVTRADSETGLRYQKHAQGGSWVMLFARLRQQDRGFYFLGPATYVSHRSEKPMAVIWKLHYPLPGDLFASFAAAVA